MIHKIYVALFLLYIQQKLINAFHFLKFALFHYLNSNFQPFPTVNTIGHIVHGQ